VDSHMFVKRVAELSGFNKEIADAWFVRRCSTSARALTPAKRTTSPRSCRTQSARAYGAKGTRSGSHRASSCDGSPKSCRSATSSPGAIRAVFTVLSEAVSEGELRDVLHQLGRDYTALVGAPTGTR